LQEQNDTGATTRKRMLLEALAWILLIAFLWTVDTLGKISYRNQTGFGKDNFRLIAEQATSAVAVMILVLFVIRWLRVFPIRKDLWASAIIGHTAGSIIFAFGHHVLMIVQRAAIFALRGETYHWQAGFVTNLIVEYQKDIKIYIGIVAIVAAYQYYRRARVAASPRADAVQRLVVQTGRGQAFLVYDEIDYIEAARNYVEVHAGGKEYLIRDTLANVEEKLTRGTFARSHRSYLVNLSKVTEIKSVDGAPQIHLKNGDVLPLGRRYRDAFRSTMAGGTDDFEYGSKNRNDRQPHGRQD
jgi:LytTr DNA-binding domain